jgi:hypothetical protein
MWLTRFLVFTIKLIYYIRVHKVFLNTADNIRKTASCSTNTEGAVLELWGWNYKHMFLASSEAIIWNTYVIVCQNFWISLIMSLKMRCQIEYYHLYTTSRDQYYTAKSWIHCTSWQAVIFLHRGKPRFFAFSKFYVNLHYHEFLNLT